VKQLNTCLKVRVEKELDNQLFVLCKVVSKGNTSETKYGKRCELLVEILKTTCSDFAQTNRIKIIAWKERAVEAAAVRKGQEYMIFFNRYKDDIDWNKQPIKAITALKVIKATKSDRNIYFTNSNGQYDPFNKLIV